MKRKNKTLLFLLILTIAVISIVIYLNANGKIIVNTSQDDFKCQEALDDFLREIKIKTSSSTDIKVVEKETFTNSTELLDYIDKWDADNEYGIRKKVIEMTTIEPDPINFTHELKRENGGKIIKLIYSFSEDDINSVRLTVTQFYLNKNSEVICEKISENSVGELVCDLTDIGNGDFGVGISADEVEKEPKIWQGRIDTVLIKQEYQNEITLLHIGICEGGNLIFE